MTKTKNIIIPIIILKLEIFFWNKNFLYRNSINHAINKIRPTTQNTIHQLPLVGAIIIQTKKIKKIRKRIMSQLLIFEKNPIFFNYTKILAILMCLGRSIPSTRHANPLFIKE